MAEVIDGILIRDVETKNIMTKSSLPVGGYSVNPYVGCTHACKYCYASFMKRFTGHTEEWGTFLDVKHWPEIKNPKKYAGQRVVIGSVTDGYNPQEEQFRNTRKFLEQLIGSDADILICTKSDLVVRDIDLLKNLVFPSVTGTAVFQAAQQYHRRTLVPHPQAGTDRRYSERKRSAFAH